MATEQDLTPDFLTRALAQVSGGARVISATAETVGTGQMATCLRLGLTYDPPGAGPATVIAKFPSLDPNSREAASSLRAYEIEVRFYRELHDRLSVRTPEVYYSELDAPSADFLLLMQDVSPARQGDQLQGCTYEQALAGVTQLAGLHSPLWGDDQLEDLEWLNRNTEDTRGFLAEMVRMVYPGFVERYSQRLDPGIRHVCEQLVSGIDAFEAVRPAVTTVTHGDFRPDNLLFSESASGYDVFVVDWQTAVLGAGASDLSYFLASSFNPGERRIHETGLVDRYHSELISAGVKLERDDLWEQYRRYSFVGLIMSIVASMLVQRTERGDEMFMVMAQRHGQHAIDLAASEFLT